MEPHQATAAPRSKGQRQMGCCYSIPSLLLRLEEQDSPSRGKQISIGSLLFKETLRSEEMLTLHHQHVWVLSSAPTVPCSLTPPLMESPFLLSLIPKDLIISPLHPPSSFNLCRLFFPCGEEITAHSNLFSPSTGRHTLATFQSLLEGTS